MSNVIAFVRDHDDDHYEQLAERYNQSLEEDRRISDQLHRIEQRFIEGELVVLSGPRKGQPLTRKGRALLWQHIQSLMWRQAWLLDEQSRLYGLVTGWRGEVEN
jgi:hypothetical protein